MKTLKLVSLSIVVPVYNEEARLDATLKALYEVKMPKGISLAEVIFVDDGSRDASGALLAIAKPALQKRLKARIKLLSYDENRGKGYAVRQGMLAAKGDYALLCDADMSTPLAELAKLAAFMHQGAPVIVGTRKNGESTVQVPQPWYRRLMGRAFTLLTQILLQVWVSDFTCGFKVFDRDSRQAIFSRSCIDRWGYDAEILFLAGNLGYSIQEKALLWYNDDRSHVRLVRDVITTLRDLLKIRSYHASGKYRLSLTHDTLVKRALSWALIRS